MKIGVIGAGSVGATFAYATLIKGLASEIVLVDINREKAHAEALDLNHGMMFVPPARVRDGELADLGGAHVVVITGGAKQKDGQTRLDLAKQNTQILKDVLPKALEAAPNALYLVVTNPVDVLTYAALKISGLPRRQVFGSGTVLDTSRFRYLLAEHCRVSVRNVHGYIIGEHGDSELPLWSSVTMGGLNLDDYCAVCGRKCHCGEREVIYRSVRDAAYEIIRAKGATYYAIGLAAAQILEAVSRNDRSIFTVSTMLEDYYGVSDVCLSVPNVIDSRGVDMTIPVKMTGEELAAFRRSADVVRAAIRTVGF